jgi:uncharacterized protein (TIGR00304 family)
MPDSPLVVLGIILIILGMFLVVFKSITRSVQESADREENVKIRTGGVIMIGPIPVVFGSDKRTAVIAIVLVIVLMLLAILFIEWRQ